MNEKICDAIINKCIMEFIYNGCPRVVEPYTYGLSLKDNEVIRCYQIGGTSNSGEVPAWKLMEIDEIESLTISEKQFENVQPEYRRGDRGMSTIFCEL